MITFENIYKRFIKDRDTYYINDIFKMYRFKEGREYEEIKFLTLVKLAPLRRLSSDVVITPVRGVEKCRDKKRATRIEDVSELSWKEKKMKGKRRRERRGRKEKKSYGRKEESPRE